MRRYIKYNYTTTHQIYKFCKTMINIFKGQSDFYHMNLFPVCTVCHHLTVANLSSYRYLDIEGFTVKSSHLFSLYACTMLGTPIRTYEYQNWNWWFPFFVGSEECWFFSFLFFFFLLLRKHILPGGRHWKFLAVAEVYRIWIVLFALSETLSEAENNDPVEDLQKKVWMID